MTFHDSAYRSDNPFDVPGSSGPSATVQADPAEVGSVRTSYAPDRDGDPDPGEIVWTWVPFEEDDGRGKDRPVLVVAREEAGTLLAVQLSSKQHDRDHEWVALGAGPGTARGGRPGPIWTGCSGSTRTGCAGRRARWTGSASTGSSSGCASGTAGAERPGACPADGGGPGCGLRAPGQAKVRVKAARTAESGFRSRIPKTICSKWPPNRPPSPISARNASATCPGSFAKTPQPQAPRTSLR